MGDRFTENPTRNFGARGTRRTGLATIRYGEFERHY